MAEYIERVKKGQERLGKQFVFPFFAWKGQVDLSKGIRAVGPHLSLDTLMVIRDRAALTGVDKITISEIDAQIERKII